MQLKTWPRGNKLLAWLFCCHGDMTDNDIAVFLLATPREVRCWHVFGAVRGDMKCWSDKTQAGHSRNTGGLHPRSSHIMYYMGKLLTPVHSLSVLVIHFCRKISERNLRVNLVVFMSYKSVGLQELTCTLVHYYLKCETVEPSLTSFI